MKGYEKLERVFVERMFLEKVVRRRESRSCLGRLRVTFTDF